MAKQSALPLLLLAGGAAVVMSGGKKKRRSAAAKAKEKRDISVEIFTGEGGKKGIDQGGWIPTDTADEAPLGGGMETLAINGDCTKLLDMSGNEIEAKQVFARRPMPPEQSEGLGYVYTAVNPLKFNNFITGKFYQLRAQEGVEDPDTMTFLIIQEMPGLEHCPWGEVMSGEGVLTPSTEHWTPLMKMIWEDLRAGVHEFGVQQGEWI